MAPNKLQNNIHFMQEDQSVGCFIQPLAMLWTKLWASSWPLSSLAAVAVWGSPARMLPPQEGLLPRVPRLTAWPSPRRGLQGGSQTPPGIPSSASVPPGMLWDWISSFAKQMLEKARGVSRAMGRLLGCSISSSLPCLCPPAAPVLSCPCSTGHVTVAGAQRWLLGSSSILVPTQNMGGPKAKAPLVLSNSRVKTDVLGSSLGSGSYCRWQKVP